MNKHKAQIEKHLEIFRMLMDESNRCKIPIDIKIKIIELLHGSPSDINKIVRSEMKEVDRITAYK